MFSSRTSPPSYPLSVTHFIPHNCCIKLHMFLLPEAGLNIEDKQVIELNASLETEMSCYS